MPPRTRKAADNAENTADNMEDVTASVPADEPKGRKSEEREVSYAGTFYEDFDNEDHPDAVTPSPGQMLVFEVQSSNIVPIMNKRTKVLEDVEVVQILLMEGTTATVQYKTEEGDWEDSGEPEPIGEIRSLWINNHMLRKIWEQWNPEPGDIGALKFKGIVAGRSNEYQKWFGRFDKVMPRQTGVR